MAIKYSLGLPQGFVWELVGQTDPVATYELLTQWAKTAEASGFETIWVADHLVTVPPSQNFLFEVWTTVAALLRDTQTIRIGQLVTANSYRNPALQAKMASTTDVLGNGRFTFGIGAGWYEPDYQSYGYEFPDGPERLRQLDEALQVIHALWSEDEATFEGKYYTVRGAINQPKGVQTPHIPVMIAGGGEKVTLKLVAKYGDYCNVAGSPEDVARKLEILKGHCEAVGRDYNEIKKTVLIFASIDETDEKAAAKVPQWAPAIWPGEVANYGLIGTLGTIRERIAAYEAVGVDEFVISFPDTIATDQLKQFAAEFIG